jgi:hypothetical protein
VKNDPGAEVHPLEEDWGDASDPAFLVMLPHLQAAFSGQVSKIF